MGHLLSSHGSGELCVDMVWKEEKTFYPAEVFRVFLCSLGDSCVLFFQALFIPVILLVRMSQLNLFVETGPSLWLPAQVRAVQLWLAAESRSGFVPSMKVNTGKHCQQ